METISQNKVARYSSKFLSNQHFNTFKAEKEHEQIKLNEKYN